MNATATGPSKTRPHDSPRTRLSVRTLARERCVEVWLFRGERPVCRRASVDKALIFDASRYGESLVDKAIDDALKALERGEGTRHTL